MISDKVPQVGSIELEVPNLGTIQGLSYDNRTCQYLGIPYADIPGRCRRSTPAVEPWDGGKWDGTKLGPYCPQPPRDFYPLPAAHRPWLQAPKTDEFKCLNLNISVPHLPSTEKAPLLPVMVFIHGGAFVYATGSSPFYDGRFLAYNSTDLNRPTIIVTINYRLGVYDNGETGVGNYGIWDQVLALRWIQKHISGFGGDPEKVTVFGQSAGGVSVHCHLLRDERLFSSAILQSGLIRLCGVMTIDEYQILYEKMLTEVGIPLSLSPSEKIKRFLAIDEEKLTAAMVPVFITPVITVGLCDDEVLIPGKIPTSAQSDEFTIPDWCPNIMMGDVVNECIIWNRAWDILSTHPSPPLGQSSIPSITLLLEKMTGFLGPEKAGQICELYGITPTLSEKETFDIMERFTSHGMYNSLHYFAETAAKKVYAYHFDVPSLYENAWKGMAHHSFDNVMLWGVLKHTLPENYHGVGDKMTEAWIRFANGEEPWERFDKGERWMVFKLGGTGLRDRKQDAGRGYEIWEELGRRGMVGDLEDLSVELCIRRSELVAKA